MMTAREQAIKAVDTLLTAKKGPEYAEAREWLATFIAMTEAPRVFESILTPIIREYAS